MLHSAAQKSALPSLDDLRHESDRYNDLLLGELPAASAPDDRAVRTVSPGTSESESRQTRSSDSEHEVSKKQADLKSQLGPAKSRKATYLIQKVRIKCAKTAYGIFCERSTDM
jgi:hypothetical protein